MNIIQEIRFFLLAGVYAASGQTEVKVAVESIHGFRRFCSRPAQVRLA